MIQVAILGLRGSLYSSILEAMDVFSIANQENVKMGNRNSVPFCTAEILTIDGCPVQSFNNLTVLPSRSIRDEKRFNVVVIPAMPLEFESSAASEELVDWIKVQHQNGACICAVCGGIFLLAETGLLYCRSATTHWDLARQFRNKYPDVKIRPQKTMIDEGDVITAAGMTATVSLSLYLIGKFGSLELASICSRVLLIDPGHEIQSPYKISSVQRSHGDQEILKVQKWIDNYYRKSISVSFLAKLSGLGERTFFRRFSRATGDTPLEYLQRVRIESAKLILEFSKQTVEEVTWNIGYVNPNSFRRLFLKHTGLTPRDYRKKFSLLTLN